MIRRRFLTLLAAAPVAGAIVRASSVVPFVPCPAPPVLGTGDMLFKVVVRNGTGWTDARAIWGSALRVAEDSYRFGSYPHFLSGQRGPSSLINGSIPQA